MSRIRSIRGFTLVELIVVITILAILGAIGFISLQGYSGQSRDSKRTSDMRSLSTAITTKSTEGVALIAMANATTTQNMLSSAAALIGGTGALQNTDYAAGVPNYAVLGLNASNFKDPLGSEYRVGASTRSNGVFQIAAKLEPSGTNTNGIAKITGNYVQRNPVTAAIYTASGVTGTNTVTNIHSDAIGLFKKGDHIWAAGPTATYQVASVSGDGRSLVLTSNLAGTLTTVRLGNGAPPITGIEVAGLISATSGIAGTAASAITDAQGTNLPY